MSEREVKFEIENFVGIFENAFSDEFCDSLVEYFENMREGGFTKNRQDWQNTSKTIKEDDALCSSFEDEILLNGTKEYTNQLVGNFWQNIYPQYTKMFAILQDSGEHRIWSNKLQYTKVGGGYHVWHYESSNRESSNRLLTYILYLNDVEEGGETELLYYPMRIKPKKGTLILFPAAFTHTHRGNPPISNGKYIATGWVEF